MKAIFVMAAFLGALSIAAARAEECAPQTILARVNLTTDANGTIAIPVKLNGQDAAMTVDTAAEVSELAPEVVEQLHLPSVPNQFGAYNPRGNHDEMGAAVSTFAIDKVVAKSTLFRIAGDLGNAQGKIGADVLQKFDLDFDFGARKLRLLSPEHCYGKVVHWQASQIAVVPVAVRDDGRIIVPVSLDGHSLNAVIDTGSPFSRIDAETARRELGVSSSGWKHTFQSLSLEGVQVSTPTLKIVPRLTDAAGRQLDVAGANMALGMDLLRHLHVYVAQKEQRLYITAL